MRCPETTNTPRGKTWLSALKATVQKTNTDAPTPCSKWRPDAEVKVRSLRDGLSGRHIVAEVRIVETLAQT